MTKPETTASAGGDRNRDDTRLQAANNALPSIYTYSQQGYIDAVGSNGTADNHGGSSSANAFHTHPDYNRNDVMQPGMPLQHIAQFTGERQYTQNDHYAQDSDEDEAESLGGMAGIVASSLPAWTKPVSTLELIPNASKIDPNTLPPQDKFLSQFNPQLRAFRLTIVQQPIRARMCGSSDKDWRPVSPPPVLKLELYDVEGNPVIEGGFMQFLVIHTTLWKEDQEEELTVVELPHNASSKRISAAAKSRKRGVTQFGCRAAEPGLEMENNLLGDYTASSSIVEDEMGERGCFFVFPNLSIRLEGRYRLRFTLIKLPSMGDAQHPMIPTCLSSVFSDPFDVYSIKTFPGMIESTALSRSLAQQGIKIPIRNTQDNT
ncbi:hypothetical protein LPJ66_002477 [Kickxella alabastrina]|uniref:Uncharacterized protein n=1 Tax=Kickxella alabastrina TaxID=61397 RepID=A0ACC1IQB7_9FUNG|nr:hypothetical protein LPJ66_002477 [Kickxella alabastrina]